MGMLDQEVMLADGETVTAIGDTPSTNIYNTGGANGQGDAGLTGANLFIQALVRSTATSGGSATIQAVFQDSADGVTFADNSAGPVVTVANALAGTPLLQIHAPLGTRQYWRVVFRIATAALTGGTFDAFVSNTVQNNIARNSGFSVS